MGYTRGSFPMMRAIHSRIVLALGAVALSSAIGSQPATPAQRAGVTAEPGYSTMHLQTQVGSCKFLNGRGRVEISFQGSILLSNVRGRKEITGNLVRQYNANGRELYYGKGRIVVTGQWRAIQWFGENFRAVWFGQGSVRVSGEYARNPQTGEFETGFFWYEDPTKRTAWPAQGTFEYRNPPLEAASGRTVTPRRRS